MNKMEFDKVIGLARFLSDNIEEINKNINETEGITFQEQAMIQWKEYYKDLILTEVLPDGKAFGMPNNNTHMGIGNDGIARPIEYYQLLMQCYRYLYMALSSGEIYIKNSFWGTAEK